MADVIDTTTATATTAEKRAAVYCRVSKENDNAMDKQRHLVLMYAAKQGYQHALSYGDNGSNGKSFNRRGLQKLTADIAAGKIGAVFARDIDRFGDDMAAALDFLDGLRKQGVTVETMDGYCDKYHHIFAQALQDVLQRYASEKTAKPARKRKGGAVNGA